MFHTLNEFFDVWQYESESTQRMLDQVTDASFTQAVTADHRTLGRLAWHLAQTLPEMMGLTGLTVVGLGAHDPVPSSAAQISAAYRAASASLVQEMRNNWTNDSLAESDNMYGEQWTRATTLQALVLHQAHHRGQLTVLMRQAGLTVPGVYGPAREEWASSGMEPPPV